MHLSGLCNCIQPKSEYIVSIFTRIYYIIYYIYIILYYMIYIPVCIYMVFTGELLYYIYIVHMCAT